MMDQMIFILVSFFICGIGLFWHECKWQILNRNLGIDTVRDTLEEEMLKQRQIEKENEKQTPFHIRFGLPILFLLVFIIELIILQQIPQNSIKEHGHIIIAIFVIAMPFIFALSVIMQESQSRMVKFVLTLVLALIMEVLAVSSIWRLLEGYYFQNIYHFKRVRNVILTILCTIGSMYMSHTGLKKLYIDIKHKKNNQRT